MEADLLIVGGGAKSTAIGRISHFTNRRTLYLASPAGRDVLARNYALQRAHGVELEWLEKADLARCFDWLAIHDIACGTLGRSGEGWFDGNAQGMRSSTPPARGLHASRNGSTSTCRSTTIPRSDRSMSIIACSTQCCGQHSRDACPRATRFA